MLKNSESVSLDMLTKEQQSQRAAVYNGLLSIFNVEQANLALEKWSIYFYETGSVFNGINSFARDICESFNRNGQHRELVKAINFALMNKNQLTSPITQTLPVESQIKSIDVVLPSVSTPVAELSFSQAINTPDFQTFQIFMLKIIQSLTAQNTRLGLNVSPFLIELVTSMPWAETQQQQVIDLITTGKTQQTRAYRADQLKVFIKHFRMWLADELGDNEADYLLNQTIAEVDVTDAGANYSAKNFL